MVRGIRFRWSAVWAVGCFAPLACGVSGCSTLSNLTAGPQGRQAMLSERTERFHRALSFSSPAEALEYVSPEHRVEFLTRQKSTLRERTIVGVDVKDIEFNDDSSEATVIAGTRYFQAPSYHVEDREDREKWVFRTLDGGWFYDGVERSDEKGRTALEPHFGR